MITEHETSTFFQMHDMGGSRVGTVGLDPLKNHKNIGFPSNIDPDPLKIKKATKPAFNGGPLARQAKRLQRRFADGPMVVHF